MLYVKVDAAGNPVEVAKNYQQISLEFYENNSFLPKEEIFADKLTEFGYAEVPFSEPPEPVDGKKIVPDVPSFNGDIMERKWKYVDTDEFDRERFSFEMRRRRDKKLRDTIDMISPVRWEAFTEEQKAEVKDWYQYLLNLPTETGWPFVSMKDQPSFL